MEALESDLKLDGAEDGRGVVLDDDVVDVDLGHANILIWRHCFPTLNTQFPTRNTGPNRLSRSGFIAHRIFHDITYYGPIGGRFHNVRCQQY